MTPRTRDRIAALLATHGHEWRDLDGEIQALELWSKFPPAGCEGPVQWGEDWIAIESVAHCYAWLGY